MRRDKGWTRAWRKELYSDIWLMPPLYHRVFYYLRQKANWETKLMPTSYGMGMYISPGMLITSYEQIAEGVKYMEYGVLRIPNRKTIKGILDWLESNSMIIRESNRFGTIIFINHWHTDQNRDDAKVIPDGHPKKHQLDTTREVKEVKDSQEVQGNKGARIHSRSHPLSFEEYKENNHVEEEIASSIEYFLHKYEENRGEPHPFLRTEQWEHHSRTFMSCLGDVVDSHDINFEDHKAMIEKYFETDFGPDCDYRIHHYNTDGVKMCRFYEECY